MIAGENDKFTLVRCKDNDEWLALRRKGVGGSDVAAILGVSPWVTATTLWLDKTGRTEQDDISDKPYVKFGNIMEPIVGRWYAEKHPDRTVRRVNAVLRSIERPWAQASLDYEVKDGEWGVLEIKTARSAKDWADGVPAYYLAQVTHYMAVTGRPFADVAVFFRDTCEFGEYRVERDEEDIELVMQKVDEFWHDYVEKDVMPEVTGTAAEASAMASYFGRGEGFTELFDPEVDDLIAEYQDAAAQEREAKERKTEAGTRLMALVGEGKGLITDTSKVTWVRSERTSFDAKAFKADNPELYGRYVKKAVRNGGLRVSSL